MLCVSVVRWSGPLGVPVCAMVLVQFVGQCALRNAFCPMCSARPILVPWGPMVWSSSGPLWSNGPGPIRREVRSGPPLLGPLLRLWSFFDPIRGDVRSGPPIFDPSLGRCCFLGPICRGVPLWPPIYGPLLSLLSFLGPILSRGSLRVSTIRPTSPSSLILGPKSIRRSHRLHS